MNELTDQQKNSSEISEETKTQQITPTPINRRNLSITDNYDLLILMLLALFLPALVLLPIPILRVPLGLAMVLLAPGYALTEAVFAHKDDLDGVARLGLSFGLSVAVLPVLALILNYLPWGIRLWPMTISLALWILFVCGVAAFRRWQLSATGEADASPALHPVTWWQEQSKGTKRWYISGTIAILAITLYAAYVFITPNPADRLTEFYALGSEGLAESYPREVTPGEEMKVTLGIVNQEGISGNYRIEARLGSQLLAKLGPVTLKDGEKWEQPIQYKLDTVADDQKVDILLFYNNGTEAYRQLHLWVNVREKVGT